MYNQFNKLFCNPALQTNQSSISPLTNNQQTNDQTPLNTLTSYNQQINVETNQLRQTEINTYYPQQNNSLETFQPIPYPTNNQLEFNSNQQNIVTRSIPMYSNNYNLNRNDDNYFNIQNTNGMSQQYIVSQEISHGLNDYQQLTETMTNNYNQINNIPSYDNHDEIKILNRIQKETPQNFTIEDYSFEIQDHLIKITSKEGNMIRMSREHFIQGERNTVLPMLDGYIFHSNRNGIYRCKNSRDGCRASIYVDEFGKIRYSVTSNCLDHNHEPHIFDLLQKELALQKVSENKGLKRSTKSIVNECYMKESSNRKSTLERWIRDETRKLNEIESNPEVKSEFLIFGDDELIIYGDNRLYHLLLETNMIFFDQTFKITISNFYQTHSLHILKCETAFPIIYAIMKKKKVSLYEKLFKIVEDLTHCEILEFDGDIMSDYELFDMKYF